MSQRQRVTPNTFFYGLDNIANAGEFFVALTRRLEDHKLTVGEDVTPRLREFGLQIPPELADVSIVSVDERSAPEREHRLHDAAEPLEMVLTYPSLDYSGPGAVERKFQKCWNVCQTVGGAKICAKVCITIDIGLGGIHGDITGTVTVKF